MENMGFRFFEVVIDAVWTMRWPLLVAFLVFMGLQLRGFRPGERIQSLLMFLYFFLVIVMTSFPTIEGSPAKRRFQKLYPNTATRCEVG